MQEESVTTCGKRSNEEVEMDSFNDCCELCLGNSLPAFDDPMSASINLEAVHVYPPRIGFRLDDPIRTRFINLASYNTLYFNSCGINTPRRLG